MMSRLLLASALSVLIGHAQAADRPIVVELFTSQGCSSCPPAEAVLLELARDRPDVLALGFHVDYWDRLGWKDPYSSPDATRRQRSYQGLIPSNGVYTPQMVVDGRQDVLGSDPRAAQIAIANALKAATDVAPLSLVRDGDGIRVTIGAGSGRGRAWLVGYDRFRETPVRRGENAGRTLAQANLVRSFEPVGDWNGAVLALSKAAPAGETAAVILQAPDGRIIGAAKLEQ